jgi:uncharacterized protein (TIGR02466 family)|tara:strand:+ start:118 stop:756 length:639 start_codon:yes stop_codon:yes gene_type:complete
MEKNKTTENKDNKKITGMFGIPIFEKDFVFKEKKEFIEWSKKQGGRKISNVGGFQSNDYIRSKYELKEKFVEKLAKDVGDAIQAYGPGKFRLICTAVWTNINGPEAWNITHTHPQTDFTATVYLEVPEDSGILIIDSVDQIMNFQKFYNVPLQADSLFARLKYSHYPRTDSLIIFPAHLPHSVTVNKSNKERISISANFAVERKDETQTNNS